MWSREFPLDFAFYPTFNLCFKHFTWFWVDYSLTFGVVLGREHLWLWAAIRIPSLRRLEERTHFFCGWTIAFFLVLPSEFLELVTEKAVRWMLKRWSPMCSKWSQSQVATFKKGQQGQSTACCNLASTMQFHAISCNFMQFHAVLHWWFIDDAQSRGSTMLHQKFTPTDSHAFAVLLATLCCTYMALMLASKLSWTSQHCSCTTLSPICLHQAVNLFIVTVFHSQHRLGQTAMLPSKTCQDAFQGVFHFLCSACGGLCALGLGLLWFSYLLMFSSYVFLLCSAFQNWRKLLVLCFAPCFVVRVLWNALEMVCYPYLWLPDISLSYIRYVLSYLHFLSGTKQSTLLDRWTYSVLYWVGTARGKSVCAAYVARGCASNFCDLSGCVYCVYGIRSTFADDAPYSDIYI